MVGQYGRKPEDLIDMLGGISACVAVVPSAPFRMESNNPIRGSKSMDNNQWGSAGSTRFELYQINAAKIVDNFELFLDTGTQCNVTTTVWNK